VIFSADAARLPLADRSVDLVIGSPPYTRARTYGETGIARDLHAWVEWMLTVTTEALRVSRGLVLWVCAGGARRGLSWQYDPAPEGLLYEWAKRGGSCLRPVYWHRFGIAGSGGRRKDTGEQKWYSNVIEYVLCFKRPGCDFYGDARANGHPPKWAPGGAMSHRLSDGARVNQWGKTGTECVNGNAARKANGERQAAARPSHRMMTKRHATRGHKNGDTVTAAEYVPPAIANPGNLITTELAFEEIRDMVVSYADATKNGPAEILCGLRKADEQGQIPQWLLGICATVFAQELLQPSLHGGWFPKALPEEVPTLRGDFSPGEPTRPLLQQGLRGRREGESAGTASDGRPGAVGGTQDDAEDCLRRVRPDEPPSRSPRQRGRDGQLAEESTSALPLVPPQGTQEASRPLPALWKAGEEVQNLWAFVRHALPKIQEVWRSSSFQARWRSVFAADESPNLIHVKVGGGLMGHPLAHDNEAPYPVGLPKYLIRSHCPPGGTVLDPFAGSGTTAQAALELGRVPVLCDLRLSQCQLSRRRLTDVQPDLFA
jgi:hypothetical protein